MVLKRTKKLLIVEKKLNNLDYGKLKKLWSSQDIIRDMKSIPVRGKMYFIYL